MNETSVKKWGKPKGTEKPAGSGRRKGSLNRVTRLRQEMANSNTPMEKYTQLRNKMWELGMNGSVNAAKAWLEEYHRSVASKIESEVDSFEDLDKAGELVVKEAMEGKLPLSTAKELMGLLLQKRELKAGALLPLMKELIEKQKEVNKGRRP